MELASHLFSILPLTLLESRFPFPLNVLLGLKKKKKRTHFSGKQALSERRLLSVLIMLSLQNGYFELP